MGLTIHYKHKLIENMKNELFFQQAAEYQVQKAIEAAKIIIQNEINSEKQESRYENKNSLRKRINQPEKSEKINLKNEIPASSQEVKRQSGQTEPSESISAPINDSQCQPVSDENFKLFALFTIIITSFFI